MMNRKRRKLAQVMVVAVVMIGLLVAAWPGMAQGDRPPLRLEMKRFFEQRIQRPGKMEYYPAAMQKQNAITANSLAKWQITDIEFVGNSPSIKTDTIGHVHISFNNSGLRYAYYDGVVWHTETIDGGNAGQFSSLDLDGSRRAHIAYVAYDTNYHYHLKYAWHNGLAWQIDTADSSEDVGNSPSMVLDASGHPHIVYLDGAHGILKYAHLDNLGWHTQTIDNVWSSATAIASLAIDVTGHLHVTYVGSNGRDLKYAYFNNNTWIIQAVDSVGTIGHFVSLAVDPLTHPHIIYYDTSNQTYKYAYHDGNSWHKQTAFVAPGIGENSVALDSASRPHFAYSDGNMNYAYYDDSAWHLRTVDNTDIGHAPSLSMDMTDQPHIAYYGGSYIKYASLLTDLGSWSRIAFASFRDDNWEVYTTNSDGTNQARRTANPASDTTPKLNRGANRIVFASNRDGNNEIYAMNADGYGQTRLTNTPANEYWPTWSPDGSKIAFYSYRNGNAEIYVMNADGSNQVRLTNNSAWDGHPAWSPDGTQLVFASDRGGANDLWIMNADGTNQHPLTYGLNAAYPNWSPDGSRIIFNDDTNNDGWLDIGIINADGSNLVHPLGYSPTNYDYASPSWSPTGQDYVFAKIQWIYYRGNYYWVDAYLYGMVAGALGQLTSSGLDWWPDWQTTDVWPPSSQIKTMPTFRTTTQFTVEWSGADTGPADIMSFDIQYRDGSNGTWVDWLNATGQTSAAFNGLNGHTYYFRSRARDYALNLEAYPGGNGDTWTTVDAVAPTSSANAPLNATSLQIPVTWSGSDAVSGLASYDVQYRDGALGQWTDWVTKTTQTALSFSGQLGHTYYFQSRARDNAGNLEAYPGGDGDTHSATPLYVVNGTVKNNRDQAVALAAAQTMPAALNNPKSDYLGGFALYYNLAGTFSLTATRSDFGLLPFMPAVIVSSASSSPIVYLPPLDNHISDSHFENGDLSAWNPNSDLTPTLTSTAHTGNYAALLGGIVPSDTLTTGPWHSTIAQTIAASPVLVSGTLSLLYRVQSAEPLSDTLTAYVIGTSDTLSFTLPLTATNWTHVWFDLSAWTEPTATVELDFAVGDVNRPAEVLADEITWGSAIQGSYGLFLPQIRR